MRRSVPGPFHPQRWSGPSHSVPMERWRPSPLHLGGHCGIASVTPRDARIGPFAPARVLRARSSAPVGTPGTVNRSCPSGYSWFSPSHPIRGVRGRTVRARRGTPGSAPGTPKSAGNRTVRARGYLGSAPGTPRRVLGTRPSVPEGTSGSVTGAPKSAGDRAFLTRWVFVVLPCCPWSAGVRSLCTCYSAPGLFPGTPKSAGVRSLCTCYSAPGLFPGTPKSASDRTFRTLQGSPGSLFRRPDGQWPNQSHPGGWSVLGPSHPSGRCQSGSCTRKGTVKPGRSRPGGHVGLGPLRPEGRGELSRRSPKGRRTRGC
jgi:hypothetical protein